jgi:hypothetical protein
MIKRMDVRKIRCIDGLHYSFQILEYFYGQLYQACCSIQKEPENITIALLSCWGFIDALHRIRDISQSTPGINVKSVEMRAFLNATCAAEEYRHYIQHLRGELANDPPNTFPVWGTISWVDPEFENRCHTAIFGAQIPGTTFDGCVYDRNTMSWVSRVCLGVNSKSFNFDPVYQSVVKLKRYLIPEIINNISDEITFHERLTIVSMDILFDADA